MGRCRDPRDEHAAVGLIQPVRRRHVLPGRLPGQHGERVSPADHRGQAGGKKCLAGSRGRHPDLPRGSQIPSGPQLLARNRPLRQHPAGHRRRPGRGGGAAASEHAPGDLRFSGERADRHSDRSAPGRRPANLRPRHPGSRDHAPGQAVPECRGVYRHAAVRPGTGRGRAGDCGPVHARSQLSPPVPGGQSYLARDHLPHRSGWQADPELRGHDIPGARLVRWLHGSRRPGRRRMLVRPAPQAGGVQIVGPAGRPA